MLKYVLRAVYFLFLGRLWRQSQYISAMSETQGGGRTRLQLGRESQRRYGGNGITESGQLHVDYFCLMFTFNVR